MSESERPAYLDPYRRAVEKFGPGFRATLWGNERTQRLRFDVMIELCGFDECVVLDAGCGQGDFASHLIGRDVAFARYVGIDAVEEMVQRAIERMLPRCEFIVADFVTHPEVMREVEVDYICFSGTLNTMDDETARGLVKTAFDSAAQGVAFNFLSDRPHEKWAGQDLGPARRFDTLAWIEWSLGLSKRVTFTQDYLDGHDATIVIRHE